MSLFLVPPFLVAASVPGPEVAIHPWWGLFFAILLVALNGFFVAAEFALVKVRPTQIDPWVSAGAGRGPVRRRPSVRPGRGPPHPGRPLGAAGPGPGEGGAPHGPPSGRLPLGDPARHHPGQPGAGLDRRAGFRLDPHAPGPSVHRRSEGAPLDRPDHLLHRDHDPSHRARRAGPQVGGDPTIRGDDARPRTGAPLRP